MRPPPDVRRIHAFRHWAPMFEALDHESGPTSVAVVSAGSLVLAWLALVEGHPVRDDVAGLTLVAFLALAALGAALVMAAGEAVAWLLARPVGRDLARATASLEHARVAVARLRPIVRCRRRRSRPVYRADRAGDRRPGAAARGRRCCRRRLGGPTRPCSSSVASRPAGYRRARDRSRGGAARRRVASPPLDRCLSMEPGST